MATTITFDGNNLNTSNIITSDVDDSAPFERTLGFAEYQETDGASISTSRYGRKPISITGLLKSTDVDALETLIDTFEGYFNGKNKNLDIGYAASTRRYICTAERVIIKRPVRGANWANFQVDLIATQFGRDTTLTSLLAAQTQTAASADYSLTFNGSAPVQQPIIEITIVSITPAATNTVTIKNMTTGRTTVIQETLAAADVLLFDSNAKTITKNGTAINFSGYYPEFEKGTHTLRISTDLVTFQFSIDVDYYKRYK